MNVLVIYGGGSAERDISLMSGAAVGDALQQAGHTVSYYDPASGVNNIADSLKNIDVVFPILHGKGGEDGVIQKVLEQTTVPYVGSNSDVSAICFDKWQTIQNAPSIIFPECELVSAETINESELIKAPYVIKPRAEGSSVDTFIVKNPAEFHVASLQQIFTKYNNELLLSRYIKGTEITVAVLNDTALPVIEILPPEGQEFDFINKYNGATKELCPPLYVPEEQQLQAQKIAEAVHTTLGCRHFSRTDMIIDENGTIFTLEINTLPGMTNQSLFPLAASEAGYTMPQLVDCLVHAATNDYQSKG